MFKPLLASPAEEYRFPLLASIKIDGIRCCVKPGAGAVSRRILPIPNDYIRTMLTIPELHYHDGEILTFTNGKMDLFNTVQSKVMTGSGTPDFTYFMFDHFQYPESSYSNRIKNLRYNIAHTKVLTQIPVNNIAELDVIEAKAIEDGYEGLIVRSSDGIYKYGRSTAKEGILLKVVRKQRAEAVITGTYERMHNANEATTGLLGYTERSSHKDNKIGRGDLGGLNLLWDGMVDGTLFPGVTIPEEGSIAFSCGTGFDDEMRSRLWGVRETLPGKVITFEFRGVGVNSRPRFPAFIGFRLD